MMLRETDLAQVGDKAPQGRARAQAWGIARDNIFFWDAINCWVLGRRKGFFLAINGYRPFVPAPWDKYLWVEFLKKDIAHRG